MKKSEFLHRIKSQTQTAHQHIEQNYLTASLVAERLKRTEYILLLEKFLSFYLPCEQELLHQEFWQKEAFDIEKRLKTPLIIKDLNFLGFSESKIKQLEKPDELPELRQNAQIMGYLYVVEGSTLGGQILGRHLQSLFGFTDKHGAAFFYSYGKENLGIMWRSFQNLLENFINQFPEEENLVIDSANQTFHLLNQHLCS